MYIDSFVTSIVRPKYYNGSKKANWPVKDSPREKKFAFWLLPMPAAEPDNENEKDEQDETYTSRNAYNNSQSQMKKKEKIN